MFRISLKRKPLNFINSIKPLNRNYSQKSFSPYHQILNKHQNCNEASFLPWMIGLTTLGLTTLALSYHYNKSIQKSLKPYLSDDVFKFIDEYLGPNNVNNFRKKIEEFSILNKITWFSTAPVSINSEILDENIKPIPSKLKTKKKVQQLENNIPETDMEKSLQMNTEFSTKASAMLANLESISKDTIEQLVAFEAKIKEHSLKLKVAIEDDGTSKHNPWEDVNAASHQQQTAKTRADNELKKLEFIIKKVDELALSAAESSILNSNPSLKMIQEATANTKYALSKMQADIEKAQFNAQITNQYKELIQQGRERFKQELSSLSPNVSSWTKKRAERLSNEDLNALIIHAHRRIYQLQARIAELESMEAIKLETALAEQRRIDDEATVESIKRELERETSKMMIERQADLDSLKQRHEGMMRQALTRQATAHSEHLTQLLKIQREEIEKQLDLSIREALLKERERMREAIDGWRMRVEGLEAAVEGRADQERLSREAQDLWVACHALQGVLNGPGPTPPLARYISSFEEAAQPTSLPVVRLFLSSVPESALSDGVCTQDVLTKRFDKLKRTCKRVAMIDETGGSLGMYLVSWLRSLFIMTQSCLIERETLVDPVNDQIDTHQILASAELAIWRQDVDLAIRLLNLLHGMPRAVAHDWIEDARVYLETKLAAEALGSYTSSKTAGSVSGEVQ